MHTRAAICCRLLPATILGYIWDPSTTGESFPEAPLEPLPLSPGHARLRALEGDWQIELQSFMSGTPQPGSAHAQSRMDLRGRFLISNYREESGFAGHGVYGYDPDNDRYSMHWFDSQTRTPPTQTIWGDWQDGQLCFRSQGPQGHTRYLYTFEDRRHFRFQLESSDDGRAWRPLLIADYRCALTGKPSAADLEERP